MLINNKLFFKLNLKLSLGLTQMNLFNLIKIKKSNECFSKKEKLRL